MSDIALSQGVRQNLLSMQKTVDLMGRTQHRLATGKKVNSALDNPTSFFVASGLQNRAGDLSRILDSMSLAIKTLETTDNGIKAIKKLIESAQGNARQALQTATSTASLRSTISMTPETALVGSGKFDAGDTITISVGNTTPLTTKTFTLTAANGNLDTVGELIDAINSDTTLNPSTSAPKVHATLDEGGKLVIEAVNGENLKIELANATTGSNLTSNTLAELFGTAVTSTEGSSVTRNATHNASREAFAKEFERLKGQIDQTIKDTGYNGTNLLNGDTLKVLFNENNTSFVNIEGVVFDSQGLGLSAVSASGTSNDSRNKWQSDKEINEALAKLDAAMNRLRTQAATFGSNLIVLQTRQDFTKQSVATLNAGADMLTLADTSEEGANLLALQTRQQLSTQALSLASQTDQAVLRLFG